MSYPPPPGGFPYPPNSSYPGGQNNLGFSGMNQNSGGVPYPQVGGGFPCPPSNPTPMSYPNLSSVPSSSPYPPQPSVSLPYSLNPALPQNPPDQSYNSFASQFSANPISAYSPNPTPYQPIPSPNPSPYPPVSYPNSAAPYPPQANPSYPPQTNSSPFAPQFTSTSSAAPYPPNTSGYPPQATNDPYSALNPSPQSAYNAPLQNDPYSSGPSPTSGLGYASVGALGSAPNSMGQGASTYYSQSTSPSSYAGCMWPYQERPTLRPANPFDPSTDAAHLRKAMKGFGTDEAAIIRILGRRTSEQRQSILLRYQQSFGKDLIKDLNSELSGDFRHVVQSLMVPLPTFLARELNKAVMGLGTNERTLIEILCTNDNNALRKIKTAYQSTYRKPLEADIRGDTSGYFGRLMVALATAYRDEQNTNTSLAPGLAQSLYKAGVKKFGTDEAEFIRILSCYSYPLLRCVFEEYKKVSGGKSFESAIKSELSGDFRDGMLSVYWCVNNRAALFARYLHESMRGFGTLDQVLVRIVVSRSEIDMGNIKDEYRRAYGKRLEDAISGDTSGDYKKMLLTLIQD